MMSPMRGMAILTAALWCVIAVLLFGPTWHAVTIVNDCQYSVNDIEVRSQGLRCTFNQIDSGTNKTCEFVGWGKTSYEYFITARRLDERIRWTCISAPPPAFIGKAQGVSLALCARIITTSKCGVER